MTKVMSSKSIEIYASRHRRARRFSGMVDTSGGACHHK